MEILLTLHSWTRWLIVVVGVIAFVKFLIGWLRKSSFQPMDRGLMSGFVGFLMSLYVGSRVNDVKTWTAELIAPIKTSLAVYDEKFLGHSRDLGAVTTSIHDMTEQMKHNRANIHDLRNKVTEAVTGVALLNKDMEAHSEQDKDNFERVFNLLDQLKAT